MKELRYFQCDGKTPTKQELIEAQEIARRNNCIVVLKWKFPYSGEYSIDISSDTNIDVIYDKTENYVYPV